MMVVLILLGVKSCDSILCEECLQLVDIGKGSLKVMLQLFLLLDQVAYLSGLGI
jgi:competence protein ComGF